MVFKTVRNKKEKEQFAHFGYGELASGSIPLLLSISATMEGIAKDLSEEDKNYFLEEYEMVLVSITVYALP